MEAESELIAVGYVRLTRLALDYEDVYEVHEHQVIVAGFHCKGPHCGLGVATATTSISSLRTAS